MNIKMFVFRDPVFSINNKHTIEFAKERKKIKEYGENINEETRNKYK